jgi:hypothetical protein
LPNERAGSTPANGFSRITVLLFEGGSVIGGSRSVIEVAANGSFGNFSQLNRGQSQNLTLDTAGR